MEAEIPPSSFAGRVSGPLCGVSKRAHSPVHGSAVHGGNDAGQRASAQRTQTQESRHLPPDLQKLRHDSGRRAVEPVRQRSEGEISDGSVHVQVQVHRRRDADAGGEENAVGGHGRELQVLQRQRRRDAAQEKQEIVSPRETRTDFQREGFFNTDATTGIGARGDVL